jgi:MFS transporter, DHA1 family, solute carrier family 18 (vesicular amine transporter), member 1/2
MQKVWGYDSTKVGLVSIAAVVPTIFASPLAGWYSDKAGAELVTMTCTLAAIPWFIVLVIPESVVLFIVAYAFVCMHHFLRSVCPRLTYT